MFNKRLLGFLVLVVFMGGCTIVPKPLISVETTEKAQKLFKKKSMVFGRLVSGESGYKFSLNTINQDTKRKYTIVQPAAGQIFTDHKQDNRDGYFFVFLPEGQYSIDNIAFGDYGFSGSIETSMEFNVPKNSFVYLGDVFFQWEQSKNYLIMQQGFVNYSVEDEYDEAVRRLWARFPEFKNETYKVINEFISQKNNSSVFIENLKPVINKDKGVSEQ